MNIIIDAGHGGRDPGAINNKYQEKDFALNISRYVVDLLQSNNFIVIPTRINDYFLKLFERVTYSNLINADLFVSIHINSAKNPSAQGIETYHYPGSTKGKILANRVHSKIKQSIKDFEDRGIKTSSALYILRETKCPAILLELGFISNNHDLNLLKQEDIQIEFAKAITNGILAYIREVK